MGFRIVFAGTPEFAVPTLEALQKSHEVVGVLTQPARPKGRGRTIRPTPVAKVAQQCGLTLWTPTSLDDPATTAAVRALEPDFIVVAAYGLLFPEPWLHLPNHGVLNVHPSLLPRWRGASPIEYALLHGDRETGVSIQALVKRLDAGPVFLQVKTDIAPGEGQVSLEHRLSVLGAKALLTVLTDWFRIQPTPQEESGVTYAPKITARDARIDWSSPAAAIARQVRALQERPGAWTNLHNRRIKILDAHALPISDPANPGTLSVDQNGELRVTTGDGALVIDRLQTEGARPLHASEWLRGTHITSGMRFG